MREIAVVDIRESYCVISVHAEGLKGGAAKGSAVVQGAFLAEAASTQVKEALNRLSPDPEYLVLLLPRHLFYCASIEAPARSPDMLSKMMEFEVPRHFPIPQDHLVSGWTIAEKSDAGYAVNIAGLKREDYEAYYTAARNAGLHPDIVSLPLLPCLPGMGEEPRTVVSLSQEGFELSLAKGKKVVHSLWRRFKPPLDARDFFSEGVLADGPAPQAADQIAAEIGRLPLVAGVDDLPKHLDTIKITGGSARLRAAVVSRLAGRSEFRTAEVVSFPAEGGLDFAASAIAGDWPRQSAGMFNFIPKNQRRLRHHVARRLLRGSAAAIGVLLVLWAGVAYGVRWNAARGLENELARLKEEARKGEGARLRSDEYRSYFEGLNAFTHEHAFDLASIAAVTNGLPRNAFITELDFRSPCQITVAGVSADAAGLLRAMESNGFKNTQMLAAVQTTPAGERFKMGMECR